MTVVDVNTGKFTGSGGNLEETVTKNNLEAAEEVVRQLRLRDIGGIIVVDFIDMVLESNRDLVLRRLVECLGRDRTRHQVAEVTSLGLVQMTRKRIGTGLLEAFSENCAHCQGRGLVIHEHAGRAEARRRRAASRWRRRRWRSAAAAVAAVAARTTAAATTGGDGNGRRREAAHAEGRRRDGPRRARRRGGRGRVAGRRAASSSRTASRVEPSPWSSPWSSRSTGSRRPRPPGAAAAPKVTTRSRRRAPRPAAEPEPIAVPSPSPEPEARARAGRRRRRSAPRSSPGPAGAPPAGPPAAPRPGDGRAPRRAGCGAAGDGRRASPESHDRRHADSPHVEHVPIKRKGPQALTRQAADAFCRSAAADPYY